MTGLPMIDVLGVELLSSHVQLIIRENKLSPVRIILWSYSKTVMDWLSSQRASQPRKWTALFCEQGRKNYQ